MSQFLLENYQWLKAFHLIAVVSWMAGMLYLPRLYVYHVNAKKGSDLSETLKIMERRLLRLIMNPAMMVTWVIGVTMIATNPAIMSTGAWIHVKMLLVALMTAVHMMMAVWRKKFERDENVKSEKFYRLWNEAPTLLMVFIIILVIVKPF